MSRLNNGVHVDDRDKNKVPLKSAPPPWHTVAFVVGLLALLLPQLASGCWSTIDEIATPQTYTSVLFPRILSLKQVGIVRLGFGCIMLGDATYTVLWGKWEQDTDYYARSKLIVVRKIPFRGMLLPDGNFRSGWMTLSSFTMWCFTLEGVAFVLAGTITLMVASSSATDTERERVSSPWLLRTAILSWEISAPFSLLVSAIVKYVLWPLALHQGSGNASMLKHPGSLLEHNLNSIAALTEVGLLGGLPCRLSDFALAPLFGILYLLYSWWMMHSWVVVANETITNSGTTKFGPQFIYPFFDTTLGATTSVAILLLLLILTITMALFVLADYVLVEAEYLGKSVAAHALAVTLLAATVCRFRD